MKKVSQALYIVLNIIFVLFSSFEAYAQEKIMDGFVYEVINNRGNNEIRIARWTGTASDVIIPSSIDGFPVKEINAYAFKEKKINSIVLHEGLIRISTGAFKDNNIAHIILPESLSEIHSEAFGGNPIKSVEIRRLNLKKGIYGLPDNLLLAYILHNSKNGVYTNENGVWKLDGQTPLPYARITTDNNTSIARIDGNYGSNYVSNHVEFIAPGTKFSYIIPTGKHNIELSYWRDKIRSLTNTHFSITLEAGKTYHAKGEVKENLISYTIDEIPAK